MEQLLISGLEVTGLGVFIFYLFRALSAKINGLENVISSQNKTIETMDKRIEETEKIGGIYKNLIADLPADIDNYKTIISKTKDEVIFQLQQQKEETEKKLTEAEDKIRNSGSSKEEINAHLSVLKNLLAKPEGDVGSQIEYDIKKICEFENRIIEDAIPILIKSKTLEEFLSDLNFNIEVTDNNDIISSLLSPERVLPSGEKLRRAMFTDSMFTGWVAIGNNNIWLNQDKLNSLKDEFSSIKTII